MPEGFQNVLSMEDPYIDIEIDVRMPVVQFYGECLMTAGLERFGDGARSSEQFQDTEGACQRDPSVLPENNPSEAVLK